MDLDKYQKKAVSSTENKISVLAGPGSGKTRTIIARVEELLKTKEPETIACITFTNSAAETIKSRITKPIGYVGTLHAFCMKKIFLETNLRSLLPEELALEEFRKIVKKHKKVSQSEKFSKQLKRNIWQFFNESSKPKYNGIYEEYLQVLYESEAICYDSVLALCYSGFKTQTLSHNVKHILVDEFQDSNDIDFLIYKELDAETMFFVGDPRQSIFGFRGANPMLMINLIDEGFSEYNLEKNYRSDIEICKYTNTLQPDFPSMKSHSKNKGKIKAIPFDSDFDEIHYLNNLIRDDIDLAILCRTNVQANKIKSELASKGRKFDSGFNYAASDQRKLLVTLLDVDLSGYSTIMLTCLLKLRYPNKSDYFYLKLMDQGIIVPKGNLSTIDYLLNNGVDMNYISFLGKYIKNFEEINYIDLKDLINEIHNSDISKDDCYIGTIHSAKSREWDHVVVPFCIEGQMPINDSQQELNIFYVACTRARKSLTFTYSDIGEVFCYSSTDSSFQEKSRFLENL